MKTKILSTLGFASWSLSVLELVSYGVGLIGAILFALAQFYAFKKNKTAAENEKRKQKYYENEK